MSGRAAIVIVGGGMVGAATAYHLAVRQKIRGVTLVEAGEPLGLTSAMGTEAYRQWWPGATMRRFIGRSIDLLEEVSAASGEAVGVERQGYLFVTGDAAEAARLGAEAEAAAARGEGPLRVHPGGERYTAPGRSGWREAPAGLDLFTSGARLRASFPFLCEEAIAGLHVRRCGFLDAQRLGRFLLGEATRAGAEVLRGRVVGVEDGFKVRLEGGAEIGCEKLVLAPGPMLAAAAAMLGAAPPVRCELHAKVHIPDPARVAPEGAPLTIWQDPVRLGWSAAEAAALASSPSERRWLEVLPGGAHFRRRGADLLGIWTTLKEEGAEEGTTRPEFPPVFDPWFAEVMIRGLARLVPGVAAYFGAGPRCRIDGGYYCKAPDNLPLIGALPTAGAYVVGALSGFGIMGAQAAAELVTAHVLERPLPDYAGALAPARFADPSYAAGLDQAALRIGQL